MFLTVHGLAGLAIGSKIANPWLAFISGFISHFMLDAVPHDPRELFKWVKNKNEKTRFLITGAIDLSVLALIIFTMSTMGWLKFNRSIVAAIIGGLLPDFIWSSMRYIGLEKHRWAQWYFHHHEKVHRIFYQPIYVAAKIAAPVQIMTAGLLLIIYFYKC